MSNDCFCCAERKLIKLLKRIAFKKGVKPHNFSTWVHRVYGDMNIWRMRKDGILGCSLPCVMCRKVIERCGIQWTAYDGSTWVHSKKSEYVPKSQPTNKQRRQMKFTFSI